jgi:hypothetical protein
MDFETTAYGLRKYNAINNNSNSNPDETAPTQHPPPVRYLFTAEQINPIHVNVG